MQFRRIARILGDPLLASPLLLLRGVGVVLPNAVLWRLLWPVAMLRAAWELGRGRPRWREYRELAGLPMFARDGRLTLGRLLLGRARLNLAKLLFLWPERLASDAGVPCRILGEERLEQLASRERPIVLVTLHFGPMVVLFNWLRARGLPVAVVALKGRRRFSRLRRRLGRLRDARAGLERCPLMFELGEVWAMHDHLAARSILLVAVDGGRGRHACSPAASGLTLCMRTGSLRLAAATGALVMPCLMRSGPAFSLTLSLGEPLPAEALRGRRDEAAACAHLFREFLPMLAAAPEECSYELLASLHAGVAAEEPAAMRDRLPEVPRPPAGGPPTTAGAY